MELADYLIKFLGSRALRTGRELRDLAFCERALPREKVMGLCCGSHSQVVAVPSLVPPFQSCFSHCSIHKPLLWGRAQLSYLPGYFLRFLTVLYLIGQSCVPRRCSVKICWVNIRVLEKGHALARQGKRETLVLTRKFPKVSRETGVAFYCLEQGKFLHLDGGGIGLEAIEVYRVGISETIEGLWGGRVWYIGCRYVACVFVLLSFFIPMLGCSWILRRKLVSY